MAGCAHGMEPTWCYLCRIDGADVDAQILWGIALDDDLADLEADRGPMTPDVAAYLRFLCGELDLGFDPAFTQREAALVIGSFLRDPATASQTQTLEALGALDTDDLAYAEARSKIRRTIALRGLRSA
jgi:hypothetical protein